MPDEKTSAQSADAKKAEFNRPYHGATILTQVELSSRFKDRAGKAIADFQTLRQKGVSFSPFLEIGAGSVQRSLALLNEFGADGVATDISQNSLLDHKHMRTLLHYEGVPMLICCDAHDLPFQADSFRFIFAYQTLHHFQDPAPVLQEAFRVLGRDGYLFFNEEPLDSSLRRFLRGNRMLKHPPTRLQQIGYKYGVEKLFWDDGAFERSLGMTEARFDRDLWRKVLGGFSKRSIEVNSKLKIRSDLNAPVLDALISALVGGNVKGLCQKTTGSEVVGDFRDRLRCLDCNSFKFTREQTGLVCDSCRRVYPITENVIRMLPRNLEESFLPC